MEKNMINNNKKQDPILSFVVPEDQKDHLKEYCEFADKTQSQVLREALKEYFRFAKTQYFETALR
tara:strand:+ start:145 stop:339 length:195 start_codon:yes stop_codon:yes gene_type:complete